MVKKMSILGLAILTAFIPTMSVLAQDFSREVESTHLQEVREETSKNDLGTENQGVASGLLNDVFLHNTNFLGSHPPSLSFQHQAPSSHLIDENRLYKTDGGLWAVRTEMLTTTESQELTEISKIGGLPFEYSLPNDLPIENLSSNQVELSPPTIDDSYYFENTQEYEQRETAQSTNEVQVTSIDEYQESKDNLEDLMAAVDFQVIDSRTDRAVLEDGRVVERLYASPRPISVASDGTKYLREKGWNLFHEFNRSRLRDSREGYRYGIDFFSKQSIDIQAGAMEHASKEEIIYPSSVDFSQHQEAGEIRTSYNNLYPGIDVVFRDYGLNRERIIIIKEVPQDMPDDDELIFWEEYSLPEGATVWIRDKQKVRGREEMGREPVHILLEDGMQLTIGGALVYDSFDTSPMYIEFNAQGLEQILEVNYEAHVMRIGIKVPANYLKDENRVYPVIIDPIYSACKEGDEDLSCAITDFYLRAQNGSSDNTNGLGPAEDNADLFVGNWWNGAAYTRHAVMQFAVDFVGVEGQVDEATLKMYYRNIGNGSDANVNMAAKRITKAWPPNNISALSYEYFKNNFVSDDDGININSSFYPGWINFDVTESVKKWEDGELNWGLIVEPIESWTSSNIYPPASWANRLMNFDSESDPNNTGPYLEIVYVPTPVEQLPDLTNGGSVSINSPVMQGDTLEFTHIVENNGTLGSGSFITEYYISDDTVIDEPKAGGNIFSNIDAGGNQSMNFSYPIPLDMTPGDYYFIFDIDAPEEVEESNETNNTFHVTFSVTEKVNLPPDSCTLSTPSNGSTVDFSNVGFSWNCVDPDGSVGNVYIQIDDDINFGSPDIQGWVGSDNLSSINLSGFDIGKTYYWRVVAQDNEGLLGNYWSPVWSFTTQVLSDVPPDPCTLSSPLDGQTGVDIQPLLQWVCTDANNDIANVYIQIDNNSDMSSPEIAGWIGSPASSFDFSAYGFVLEYDTTFYWRVYAKDSLGNNSPTWTKWSFHTKPLPPDALPDQCELSAPADGTTNVSPYTSLSWTCSDPNNDIVDYVVQIDDNNDFSSPLAYTYTGSAGTSWSPADSGYYLNYDTTYYWRVYAKDSYGNISPYWSSTFTFSIKSNTSGGGGGSTATPTEEQAVGQTEETTENNTIDATEQNKNSSNENDDIDDNKGGDPVNTRTGSFEHTMVDFRLPGKGEDIDFTRVYNSKRVDVSGRFGNGWDYSYNQYYYQHPETKNINVFKGGTTVAVFTTNDNGNTFSPPPGETDTLYWDGDTLVFEKLNGTKYVYGNQFTENLGMLAQIIDSNDNVTTLSYGVAKGIQLLTSIIDSSGREINLFYGDQETELWNNIVLIRDNISTDEFTEFSYEYDEGLNL